LSPYSYGQWRPSATSSRYPRCYERSRHRQRSEWGPVSAPTTQISSLNGLEWLGEAFARGPTIRRVHPMKRISAEAYQALRETVAVIFWNKRPFETYLRTALRAHPELLVGLSFSEPKRLVADQLVDRLVRHEDKYQDATISLMREIAAMQQFSNIERIKDAEDRALRLQDARKAVASLKKVIVGYEAQMSDRERLDAQHAANRAQIEAQRRFGDEIDAIRDRFINLRAMEDPHERGRQFERLLTDLFLLFDMEPRLSYNLEREQIDGSLTFDTDDYIVEARWRKKPTDRGDLDIFAAKVSRKGKNALGLFVSINGFTQVSIAEYSSATSFIAMDGNDLFLALDQRVRLDDLIKAKKRHANETGSCYLAASKVVP